jgi:hypothetical protein
MAERLRREVLRPQKANNGLGVMIVAATAMFFAVASSAFIVRARMHRACTHHHPPPQAVEVPARSAVEPPVRPRGSTDCPGYEVTGEYADGSKDIRFTKCDDSRPLRVPVSPSEADTPVDVVPVIVR